MSIIGGISDIATANAARTYLLLNHPVFPSQLPQHMLVLKHANDARDPSETLATSSHHQLTVAQLHRKQHARNLSLLPDFLVSKHHNH
jgi:hypothetical protein